MERKMMALRIPEELDRRLSALSSRTGRSKTFYATEAILTHIEDLEDTYLALERLEQPSRRMTLGEVKKEIGLAG